MKRPICAPGTSGPADSVRASPHSEQNSSVSGLDAPHVQVHPDSKPVVAGSSFVSASSGYVAATGAGVLGAAAATESGAAPAAAVCNGAPQSSQKFASRGLPGCPQAGQTMPSSATAAG